MHRRNRTTVALAAALTLLLGLIAAGPAAAHPEGKAHHAPLPEHATPVMRSFFAQALAPQNLASLGTSSCQNGLAGGYPCSNVDLESFLSLSDLGGSSTEEANDIWGWTDPSDGDEYAIIGMTFGTAFVDISDPNNPVYLGELPTHGAFGSPWRDIKTHNNHAFIVSEARGHGMQVFDLTRLRTASPGTTFTETAHYNRVSSSHNIVINEDSGYAYIVGAAGKNSCNGGLHMVDISNPSNPRSAGCFSADGYTHDAQCVIYSGPDTDHQGKEICLNSNEDSLTIVDVTNKNNPVQLSRTTYTGSHYTHQGWLTEDQAHFLLDDELDELEEGHGTLTRIFDVSDLDNPTLAGSNTAATAAIDHNQYVKGGYSYQANYRAGLRIMDLSDVANGNLTEAGFFDIWPADDDTGFNAAWSNYPYFDSGVVIISGIEQGLYVVRPNLGGTGGDNPPSVSLTNPADGDTVSGTVAVSADASDDNGVNQVEFFVDGTSIGVDTDGGDGWSVSWDTTTVSDGSRSVTAAATDTALQTTSDSIAVTVDNVAGLTVHIGNMVGSATSLGRGGQWEATVTVTIHDDAHTGVGGVTVDGTWTGDVGGSCVTDGSDSCTVTRSGLRKKDATATFTVDGVTGPDATYDPGQNDVPGALTVTAP